MGNYDDARRLPSVKFPNVGDNVTGTVVEIDPTATIPEFDKNGRVQGNKVDDNGVELTQIDLSLALDTGEVVVLHDGGAIHYAIGRALAQIGADDLEEGDILSVTYTGDGKPTAAGRNAPKQYTAVITKG